MLTEYNPQTVSEQVHIVGWFTDGFYNYAMGEDGRIVRELLDDRGRVVECERVYELPKNVRKLHGRVGPTNLDPKNER